MENFQNSDASTMMNGQQREKDERNIRDMRARQWGLLEKSRTFSGAKEYARALLLENAVVVLPMDAFQPPLELGSMIDCVFEHCERLHGGREESNFFYVWLIEVLEEAKRMNDEGIDKFTFAFVGRCCYVNLPRSKLRGILVRTQIVSSVCSLPSLLHCPAFPHNSV